jgi:uncharacterized protein YebE (UPF0316 family)
VAVFAGVMPGGFVMVVLCVQMVTVRHVRVMRGLQVIAAFVMLSGLVVMVRGVSAVLGCVPVVVGGCLMIGHVVTSFLVRKYENFVLQCDGPLER